MRNKYLAKKYWRDQSTPMGRIDQLAKGFDDVIDLGLGDPDIRTDDLIIDSAFRDAKLGYTKYSEFRGDPELRAEIAAFYKAEYDLEIADREIFVTAGGCMAMYLALEAILDEGDEVLMQAPYFTPYPQQIELAGGVPVELPTYESEGFQINMERLASLVNERTRAIIINSPSNPTGCVISRKTMRELAEFAIKHELIVISDDIYTAFSYQEPFVPILSIEGMRERTIVINSFSKNYTMTGWRVGNIIADASIVKAIQQINENLSFTVPSVSQRAAIYALRERDRICPKLIEEYRSRTYHAARRINEIPNMSVLYPPQGTFYLFVNIKESGLSSEQASALLLREAHILTIPGNAFGKCGEGYVRMCCTVDIPALDEVCERIQKTSAFSRAAAAAGRA